MPDIWLPGYKRVDLGPTVAGATYDEMTHPKLGWHTTEGRTIDAARTAFQNYPPHLCYDPVRDLAEQYVPLNRHAYAFRYTENDDEFVVQVEVVGFASGAYAWDDTICRRLAQRVVRPVADAVGVPPVVIRTGFHGDDEGLYLAISTSSIRISPTELRNFAGHLGHQHMPGEVHWDPGRLPIDRILRFASEASVTPEEREQIASAVWAHYLTTESNTAAFLTITNTNTWQLKAKAEEIEVGLDVLGAKLDQLLARGTGSGLSDDDVRRVADELDRRARDGDSTTGPTT